MAFRPEIHRRRTMRMPWHDYANNCAYLITICSWQRECLFGYIQDGRMLLNPMGKIAYAEWIAIASIRSNVRLGGFVIMPNHMHGLLQICASNHAGAHGLRPVLGDVIRGYKSTVCSQIRQLPGELELRVWQRGYHERIIHSVGDWQMANRYIEQNPVRWLG